MKRILVIIMVIVLTAVMTLGVCAASAFSTIMIRGENKDITLTDDTAEQWYDLAHAWWSAAGAWDGTADLTGYTNGCAFKGDKIIIGNVDFGTNGAKTVKFAASNGNETIAHYGVYLDDVKPENKIADFQIGGTGGWNCPDNAKEFTTDALIPATGVHKVIIFWELDTISSGTVDYIAFEEAQPAVTEAPVVETTTETPTAPKTYDACTVLSIMLFAAGLSFIALKKKRTNV